MSGLVSCTGAQFCGVAIIETKNRALSLIQKLEEQLEFDRPVRIHWTGCPNSCGQVSISCIWQHRQWFPRVPVLLVQRGNQAAGRVSMAWQAKHQLAPIAVAATLPSGCMPRVAEVGLPGRLSRLTAAELHLPSLPHMCGCMHLLRSIKTPCRCKCANISLEGRPCQALPGCRRLISSATLHPAGTVGWDCHVWLPACQPGSHTRPLQPQGQ